MFSWSIQIAWWYVLLFGCLSYGAVAYYYLKYKYELTSSLRYFLIFSRGTALLLLFLLLWNPYVKKISSIEIPPRIVVLHDNSASLRIHPKLPPSFQEQHKKQFLQFLHYLYQENCVVDTFLFAQTLYPYDTLDYSGKFTDFYQSFQSLLSEYDPTELNGLVLISDGIVNQGGDPRYLLQQVSFPIYTLLIGDTTSYPDLKIKQALYHPVVSTNTEHPLQIELESNLKITKPVSVTIYENGKWFNTLSTKFPNTGIATIQTTLPAHKAGLYHYKIIVDSIPNELTTLNNVYEFYVNVQDLSYHVTLFAGTLSPDLNALKQALSRDQRIRFHEYVKKNGTRFYHSPHSAVLDSTHLFLLYNFPERPEDERWLDSILTRVEAGRAHLFLVAGPYTHFPLLKKLAPYLPLMPEKPNWNKIIEVQCHFTDAYHHHPLSQFSPDFADWVEKAPPLFTSQTRWKIQPNSKVLITQKIKGIPTDFPLLAVKEMGNQRYLMLVGESFWRLRMENYVTTKRFDSFDEWLANTVIWLCATHSPQGIFLKPLKDVFSEWEPIGLTARIVNEVQKPITDAEVKVEIWKENKKVDELMLLPRSDGLYYGQLPSLPAGMYTAQMVATKENQILAKSSARFVVKSVDLEGLNLEANEEFMASIARMTKGAFTMSFDDLLLKLKEDGVLLPRLSTQEQVTPLFRLWYPWLLILVLLSLEWILRKWKGLI